MGRISLLMTTVMYKFTPKVNVAFRLREKQLLEFGSALIIQRELALNCYKRLNIKFQLCFRNVSECLYRGRRTQEAARFAAVIEAIKVAGSCGKLLRLLCFFRVTLNFCIHCLGITKLQINTDYINVIRFMIYFILKWEGNGWMTVRGTPVKNQVLIQELDYFSRLLDVKWVKNIISLIYGIIIKS